MLRMVTKRTQRFWFGLLCAFCAGAWLVALHSSGGPDSSRYAYAQEVPYEKVEAEVKGVRRKLHRVPARIVEGEKNIEALTPDGGPKVNRKALRSLSAQKPELDVVLILDSSRSMKRTDPEKLRNKAAKLFMRFLSPGDRAALVHFSSAAVTVLPLAPLSQHGLEAMDLAIDGVPVEGNFSDLWS